MNTYEEAHTIAKVAVTIIVIAALVLSKYLTLPWSILTDIIAVLVWFWGINPTAYFIEHVKNYKHKHRII